MPISEKMTKEQALDFMDMAYSAETRQSNTKLQQMKTSVWYKARKQLRGSPVQIIKSAAGFVPLVGSAASVVVTVVASTVDGKIKQSKLASARANATINADLGELRRLAKYEGKDLKEKIAKLESNQVKLKDAVKCSQTKINALSKGDNSFDELMDAAKSISSRMRYEMKILYMIEGIQQSIDNMKKYVDVNQENTFKVEGEFITFLQSVDVPEGYGEDPNQSLLQNRLVRSSSSSRLIPIV